MSDLNFIWPLSGGLLIGLSAAFYLLLDGRIAGIPGLTASAFGWTGTDIRPLGLGFLAGILAGAAATFAWIRHADLTIAPSPVLLIIGGLLVGLGHVLAFLDVADAWETVLFAAAMLAGMFAYRIASSRQNSPLWAH